MRGDVRPVNEPANADPENLGLFGEADLQKVEAAPPPALTIYVHFECAEDVVALGRLIRFPLTPKTRQLSFPPSELFPEIALGALTALRPETDDVAASPTGQGGLFGAAEWWEEFWQGMPEFVQEDQAPRFSIQFDFRRAEDVAEFEKLIGQKIPDYSKRTPSVWFPEAEIGSFANKRWVSPPAQPRYPIYVPTKGRWESRFTIKALQKIGVDFRAVVEAQEFDAYAAAMGPEKLLVLPHRDKGLVVTRNWIWDHAAALGTPRFWTMDDNIQGFWRLNRNLKVPVTTGAMLRAIEDFVDRYENVPIAGMNYFMFASRKTKMPPLTLNTRVYSNMLIRTDATDPRGALYRNEGFFNDDTDLCLRILKDGGCIALFNAFLIFKATTMTVKGGMTPHYLGDGRYKMAKELQEKHPDVTTITRKWGRWQHQVDYSRFRSNRLVQRPRAAIPAGVDDFGMELEVRTVEERAA